MKSAREGAASGSGRQMASSPSKSRRLRRVMSSAVEGGVGGCFLQGKIVSHDLRVSHVILSTRKGSLVAGENTSDDVCVPSDRVVWTNMKETSVKKDLLKGI